MYYKNKLLPSHTSNLFKLNIYCNIHFMKFILVSYSTTNYNLELTKYKLQLNITAVL